MNLESAINVYTVRHTDMQHKQDVFMLNIHTGTYCTYIQQ